MPAGGFCFFVVLFCLFASLLSPSMCTSYDNKYNDKHFETWFAWENLKS